MPEELSGPNGPHQKLVADTVALQPMIDRATLMTILQGIGIMLQMVNAQIAIVTHSAIEAIMIGSFIAGYQFVIQHLGNTTPVAAAPRNLIVDPSQDATPGKTGA